CVNFLGKNIGTKEGKEFTIKVLKFMREKLKEYQKETGNLYNLEATPAESVSYRLAKLDKKHYPGIYAAGKDKPYYTNSTFLPVNYTDDVFEALQHQNDIQPLYTGGTVFHAYLGERIRTDEAKLLVKKIVENFDLPYFTITPTFSVCQEHGYIQGEHFKCPICGKECEVYSRVVGFLTPVQNWNKGKKEEFKERVEYKKYS
ncbi:MAG: ribonucleoside triphosphate reductase, partial [Candidatus Aenigmatarchaeota archaeon]